MPQGNPKAGECYLHFKNKKYQILNIAIHSETREKMVVYQALYGKYGVYVRPYEMFISPVDRQKYPEVTQQYRFQLIGAVGEEIEEERAVDKANQAYKESLSRAEERMEQMEERMAASVEKDLVVDTKEVKEESAKLEETVEPEDDLSQVNQTMLAFFDADTFADKYEILKTMERDVTDAMIDNMSASLDLVIPDGDVDVRYVQLKNAVSTMAKFEVNRLR